MSLIQKKNDKYRELIKAIKQAKLYPIYRVAAQNLAQKLDNSPTSSVRVNRFYYSFILFFRQGEIEKLINLLKWAERTKDPTLTTERYVKLYTYQRIKPHDYKLV
jgi:hypothetical protein